jgi:hypothetical protein
LLSSACGNDFAPIAATEKCAWIRDSITPACFHIGCAADGDLAVGDVCEPTHDGIADACVRGAYCDGVCRTVCDLAGAEPNCDDGQTCEAVPGAFETEHDPPLAYGGVCR